MGLGFPLDHAKKVGKPKCSWRSKSKPCKQCGKPITNLCRSQYIKKDYCCRQCVVDARLWSHAHENNMNTVAVGVLLAEVADSLTDWNWVQCSLFAVNFIYEYQENRRILC